MRNICFCGNVVILPHCSNYLNFMTSLTCHSSSTCFIKHTNTCSEYITLIFSCILSFNYTHFYDKTGLPYIFHKKDNYCHVAKSETRTGNSSILILCVKQAVVFYLGMNIIKVFRVILYIKIYVAQPRRFIIIVVNIGCDVSNARFQWVEFRNLI